MAFNRIIHRSFRLFICPYPLINRWVFCCWKFTIVIFFIFHFTRKQQKQQLASFHTVHRVVRKKLNFGLRVCRIFSCENTIKYKTYYDDRMDTSAQNMSTKLIGLTHITSIQMSLSFDCCGIDQQFRITPLIHTTYWNGWKIWPSSNCTMAKKVLINKVSYDFHLYMLCSIFVLLIQFMLMLLNCNSIDAPNPS